MRSSVITIRRRSVAMVTQSELWEAAELRAIAAGAEKTAREYVQRLEHKIARGAPVEPGEMEFDRQLQMARKKTG